MRLWNWGNDYAALLALDLPDAHPSDLRDLRAALALRERLTRPDKLDKETSMQVTLSLKPATFWRGFTLRELRALQESLAGEITAREKALEVVRNGKKP